MKNDKQFQEALSKITYDTLRPITNIEDKISITTMLMLVRKQKQLIYADLLYNKITLSEAIEQLNNSKDFADYQIEIKLNIFDNTQTAFEDTVKRLREMEEADEQSKMNYFECLAERDSFAVAVMEIAEKLNKKQFGKRV